MLLSHNTRRKVYKKNTLGIINYKLSLIYYKITINFLINNYIVYNYHPIKGYINTIKTISWQKQLYYIKLGRGTPLDISV